MSENWIRLKSLRTSTCEYKIHYPELMRWLHSYCYYIKQMHSNTEDTHWRSGSTITDKTLRKNNTLTCTYFTSGKHKCRKEMCLFWKIHFRRCSQWVQTVSIDLFVPSLPFWQILLCVPFFQWENVLLKRLWLPSLMLNDLSYWALIIEINAN